MAIKIFYPELKDKIKVGYTVLFDIQDSEGEIEKKTYTVTKVITETITDSIGSTSNTTLEIEPQ